MTRALVTGGLGFIGSHLCRALADAGYEVTAVDDLSAPHASISTSAAHHVVTARAERAGDLGLLDEVDVLFHLAAVPGVRTTVPARRLAASNVAAVETLVRATAARGVRFVLASTSSVYGHARVLPTHEGIPLEPLNPYARTKVAAEALCRQAAASGADAVIARLFTVFGPRQRADMAFSRWIRCLELGEPVPWCAAPGAARELTYVGDAARGLIAAAERGRSGEAYNVGGCGSVQVRDALAELEDLIGSEAVLEPVESGVREAVATESCGRKAARELGYRAEVDLREGLAQQLAEMTLRQPAAAA